MSPYSDDCISTFEGLVVFNVVGSFCSVVFSNSYQFWENTSKRTQDTEAKSYTLFLTNNPNFAKQQGPVH